MKNQKGITLIALVITIIVLLILAVVSIGMVIGENGILKSATNAGDETTFESEKEVITFQAANHYDYATNGYNLTSLNSELNNSDNMLSRLTNSNKYLHTFFKDTKNEYLVDSLGNVKDVYEPTLYVYKFYDEEKGWVIRFFHGLNSLNFSSVNIYFRNNKGSVAERQTNTVYQRLYKTYSSDENDVFHATQFNSEYVVAYSVNNCPESFGENGIELWYELQSRFSDRRFATEHVTLYNLSEVKSLEEFEASLQ